MSAKRDLNKRYKVHGDVLADLPNGYAAMGMPANRWTEASAIVADVLEANEAVDFYWYKPPGTDEICCYWDDHETNMMWVSRSEVHIPIHKGIARPVRPVTWRRSDGEFVGWLLPGADSGAGGGSPKKQVDTVVCPVTFISQPEGQECPECEIVH